VTGIAGIKLEVAGRLTTQRNIPRKTLDSIHTGSFQKANVNPNPLVNLNSKLDFSQYASKNKLGAFTVKV